jgi:hypothetical protein
MRDCPSFNFMFHKLQAGIKRGILVILAVEHHQRVTVSQYSCTMGGDVPSGQFGEAARAKPKQTQ